MKPLVSISGYLVAQGFREVPTTVDEHGNPKGQACLRFNCFGPLDQHGVPLRDVPHNCPANNPNHPLFSSGSVCNKSHERLDSKLLTWPTLAVSLSL